MPHPIALTGFASDPERYEAGRPRYAPAAIDLVRDHLPDSAGSIVADVGAGTGKLTRDLGLSRSTVVAVDPVAEMLELVPRFAPHAHLVQGAAERLPFAAGSVAAITSGQAFHWFDAGAALAEFARVSRRGAPLVLVWNARLRHQAWVDELWRIMDRVEERAPWRNHDLVTRVDPGDSYTRPERSEHHHTVRMTEDDVIARLSSVSHVAVLPPAERHAIEAEARAIVRSVDGPLEIEYRTDVELRRRR